MYIVSMHPLCNSLTDSWHIREAMSNSNEVIMKCFCSYCYPWTEYRESSMCSGFQMQHCYLQIKAWMFYNHSSNMNRENFPSFSAIPLSTLHHGMILMLCPASYSSFVWQGRLSTTGHVWTCNFGKFVREAPGNHGNRQECMWNAG